MFITCEGERIILSPSQVDYSDPSGLCYGDIIFLIVNLLIDAI